jgi:hypothetical protein
MQLCLATHCNKRSAVALRPSVADNRSDGSGGETIEGSWIEGRGATRALCRRRTRWSWAAGARRRDEVDPTRYALQERRSQLLLVAQTLSAFGPRSRHHFRLASRACFRPSVAVAAGPGRRPARLSTQVTADQFPLRPPCGGMITRRRTACMCWIRSVQRSTDVAASFGVARLPR